MKGFQVPKDLMLFIEQEKNYSGNIMKLANRTQFINFQNLSRGQTPQNILLQQTFSQFKTKKTKTITIAKRDLIKQKPKTVKTTMQVTSEDMPS